MRHLRVLTGRVLLLPLRVIGEARGRRLVLPASATNRRTAPLLGTLVAAVPVAPIAGLADRHGRAAPGALELAVGRIDRCVQTGRLDDSRTIGDAPPMGPSLIAAAASGGPERLLRTSTFLNCFDPAYPTATAQSGAARLQRDGSGGYASPRAGPQAARGINCSWPRGIGGTWPVKIWTSR